MPDITLCTQSECPQKLDCWRFTAEPSQYWQSYFKPEIESLKECEYHIPIRVDKHQE